MYVYSGLKWRSPSPNETLLEAPLTGLYKIHASVLFLALNWLSKFAACLHTQHKQTRTGYSKREEKVPLSEHKIWGVIYLWHFSRIKINVLQTQTRNKRRYNWSVFFCTNNSTCTYMMSLTDIYLLNIFFGTHPLLIDIIKWRADQSFLWLSWERRKSIVINNHVAQIFI